MITLQRGDCLDLLPSLPDGSVDMVLADLPYGSTAAAWDVRIDLTRLWPELKRVTKPNAAIVMFADMRFAVELINSATVPFRYDLIWQKTMAVGFLSADKRPLRAHELMLLFYQQRPTYNPQMLKGDPYSVIRRNLQRDTTIYGVSRSAYSENVGTRHPTTVLSFSNREGGFDNADRDHSTQKPVAVLRWLISSYTNAGDVVLDPTMGSGSTGVACVATGRGFIGYELNEQFFNISQRRIAEAEAQPPLIPEAYTVVRQGEQTRAEL